MTEHEEAPLLSGWQTVESIRDTGYKSTDYAIAELIDNAVDAEAETVTVVIVEEPREGGSRITYQATEIFVIDDGNGMTEERANLALSFGGSGQFNSRTKIGRFGMGLPQASVSQCRRTEVWSWQDSQPERAHRTCLDLAEIETGERSHLTVPWPTKPGASKHTDLPSWIADLFRSHHRMGMDAGQPASSGTVVRWTQLDRLRWVKAASVVKHTEFLLGRIYRKFIADGKLAINLVIAERSDSQVSQQQHTVSGAVRVKDPLAVRANDPVYLSRPDRTVLEYWERVPADDSEGDSAKSWERVTDEPPFEGRYEQREPYKVQRPDGQGSAYVYVRYSQVRPDGRPGSDAGRHTRLGQQAKENRGISIVRANREIILEQTLVGEATDRWWGVELVFPSELDEVFGVTNNKQDAPYFTTALRYVLDYELSRNEAEEEGLFGETDPVRELYQIASDVRKRVNEIKRHAKERQKEKNRNAAPQQSNVAQAATRANREWATRHPTAGEIQKSEEQPSQDAAASEIERQMQTRHGVPEEYARVVAQQYREGLSVHFVEAGQSQSPAFFWPDEVYDDEQIYINSKHEAYERLIDPLRLSSSEIEQLTEERAKQALGRASDALALLVQAFARLELEVRSNPGSANEYQRVREEWGRRLRELVSNPSFDEIFAGIDDDESG